MAKCEDCKQEMTACDGCTRKNIAGYSRLPCDQKKCHDCGAKKGKYHHLGCDGETCPKCGEQLAFCGCFTEEEWENYNLTKK